MGAVSAGFDRGAYLRSLRGSCFDASRPLSAIDVQRRVVTAACGIAPLDVVALRSAYLEVLSHVGINVCRASDQRGWFDPPVASATNVPWYRTRYWAYPDSRGGRDGFLRDVAPLLEGTGFGRLFAWVAVAPSTAIPAQQLRLLSDGRNHTAVFGAPINRFGIHQPILLLQQPEEMAAVHTILIHEVVHAVTHYLWGLRTHQCAALDPLRLVATRFVVEVFAHAQTAAMLGLPYCYYLSDSSSARRRGDSALLRVWALHRLFSRPRDAELASALLFLETFPCFSATLGLDRDFQPGHVFTESWTQAQHTLADLLMPLARDLYDRASLDTALYEAFLELLSSEGPCGDLFTLAARELSARNATAGLNWLEA